MQSSGVEPAATDRTRLLGARLPGERHRAGGDGRLQPDAGAVPVRAAAAVRLRPGDRRTPTIEQSVLRDLQSIFPAAEQDTARRDASTGSARARPTIGIVAVVGGDLDRGLVLGRDGHRLLSHLPRRVPRLGRAEALRPGDAGGRDPVPGGQRRRSRSPRALLASSADDLPFGLDQVGLAAHRLRARRGAGDHVRRSAR